MEIANKELKLLVDVFNKILSITKSADYLTNLSKQIKVRVYEHQIDQIFYKLCGLTQKEIKTVENFIEAN